MTASIRHPEGLPDSLQLLREAVAAMTQLRRLDCGLLDTGLGSLGQHLKHLQNLTIGFGNQRVSEWQVRA